ncbi:hypothetical protein EV182_006067, partial [Spiromyces aspiralis]
EACVKERTDYCDITGEVMWVDRMRQEFGKLTEENGTAIVSFAGFDCVPSDLGTLMLADYARAQYDKPLSHAKASVMRIRGGISDGTLASFGKWQAPWMMASIDAQTVQRAAEENHYGDNFSFYESLSVSSLLVALGIAVALPLRLLMLAFPPTRWVVRQVLPQPSKGPTSKELAEGHFTLDLVGYTDTSGGGQARTVYARVSGETDPGYGETITYVCEAALFIHKVKHSGKPKASSTRVVPGIHSPSVSLRMPFVEHLRLLGLEFLVGDKPFDAKKEE